MKRKADEISGSQPSEDASDRAQKYRKPGLVRVGCDEIGFWDGNRGGLGISGYHCHEVAWDCAANGVKLQRYGHVDLIEIPPHRLQEIRDSNRERCLADPLLPRCVADALRFITGSKTHFTHAQKLCQQGGRTLFNKGEVPIRWRDGDTEGAEIMSRGPLCAIYDSKLLDDPEALRALASDDNLNASVQWGEDEMQAYGRVHEVVERLAPSQDPPEESYGTVLASLEVSGLGKFSADDWTQLIALRMQLPDNISKVLQACQFGVCAGRVRVKPHDFGLAAKLDPRAPWTKVAIMLWQYIGSMDQKDIGATTLTFQGRKETQAKKLQADVMKELVREMRFVRSVDGFIRSMLSTYSQPTSHEPKGVTSNELLVVRGLFLANCGRYIIKVGTQLDQACKKAAMKNTPLSPQGRLDVVDRECVGKLAKLESYLREKLVEKKLYSELSLPARVHPTDDASARATTAPSQAVKLEVGLPSSSKVAACVVATTYVRRY